MFPFDYQNEYFLGEPGDARFDESRVETQTRNDGSAESDRTRTDGHGEIVGYRWNGYEGEFCTDKKDLYFITPKYSFPIVCPLGIQATDFPADDPFSENVDHMATQKERVEMLVEWMTIDNVLSSGSSGKTASEIVDEIIREDKWLNRPEFPELCMVSRDLAVKVVQLWLSR